MKIGIDAKRAFFNHTGLGQYSRTLIGDLEEEMPHMEYFLFSPKMPGGKIPFKSPVVFPKGNRLFWRSYGLKKEIREKQIDIYHGLSNEIPFVAHKKLPCKFVVTIHDLIALKFPQWYPFADAQIYKAKMRYACKYADKIVAISEVTKNDILEMGWAPESKIELIYQSLSGAYQDFHSSKKIISDHPYLLYVGSFSERKNVLFLLQVFAKISKQIPHQLFLVGNGSAAYNRKILSAISKLGIESRVKILNNISNRELPQYYHNADLFLYPSQYEGFGLPVAESLACGTPVISTLGTSMEEAGKSGGLFLPLETVLWETAVIDLINDKARRTEYAEAGKSYVQKFSTKNIMPQWNRLYKSII
ncbi:MAG: glycosyltransferase family 1 protein [Chitinophagales bacterium]